MRLATTLSHACLNNEPTSEDLNENLLIRELQDPSYMDELNTARQITLKGEWMVIPQSLRKEMLGKIHTAHLGKVKCKKHAKYVLLWPGMSKDIENLIANCETCL